MNCIDTLKRLQEQVNAAVALVESGNIKTMDESDLEKNVLSRNDHYDFVVGDFAIHCLTPYDRVWPKKEESNV